MNAHNLNQNRVESTAKKIDDFKYLQAGWHYGRGVSPTSDTIDKALVLNSEASKAGFTKTNAFAGLDGEIRVTAYHESFYLELTVEPNGRITYVLEQDDNVVVYEDLSFNQALARISIFRGTIWPSLELSIATSMIQTKSVSKVSLSSPPVMVVESLSLTRSAYLASAQAFVNTSKGFIEDYLNPLLSSGTSTPKYSLTTAH